MRCKATSCNHQSAGSHKIYLPAFRECVILVAEILGNMLMKNLLARTLSVLGSVLIICGLLAVLTIGIKSRNLLIVGTLAGAMAWVLAWLLSKNRAPVW